METIARPLRDHLFVQVDAESLDRTETGIYIPDWQPGDKDATKAQVVASPVALSPKRPLEYPDMDGRAYVYADMQQVPQPGETVYLTPNTFKPELEYPGHPGVFLVPLESVVATKGEAGVVPFRGLLLCEEVCDDDVRQRADGVRVRVKDAGFGNFAGTSWTSQSVVTEINPNPIPCVLRVLHIGAPLRGQADVVQVGDVVLADRRLFAYHATNQNDTPNMDRATELGKYVLEPPRIIIDGTTYAYVPRQMVLGVQERKMFKVSDSLGFLKSQRAITDTAPRDEQEVHVLTYPARHTVGIPKHLVERIRPALEAAGYVEHLPPNHLPLSHPAYNA